MPPWLISFCLRTERLASVNYLSRQKRFAQTLIDSHLEGFIVTHPANLRYLCGYTGSNGLLLFLGGRPVFFTDGRYTQQAREEVEGARVVIAKGPLLEAARQIISAMKSATIGFEADLTTVAAASQFRKLAHKKIAWKPTSGLIMRQRLIKDAGELKIIREAVNLGAAVYESAVHSIQPGTRNPRLPDGWSSLRGRRARTACRSTPSSRAENALPCRTVALPASRFRAVDLWWWIPALCWTAIVRT